MQLVILVELRRVAFDKHLASGVGINKLLLKTLFYYTSFPLKLLGLLADDRHNLVNSTCNKKGGKYEEISICAAININLTFNSVVINGYCFICCSR